MKGVPRALARLQAARRVDVFVPQPVIAEISYGLARMPKSSRRQTLGERFDVLAKEIPRVEWTDEVSAHFGLIKADLERRGIRLEDFDVAIAAHAAALGATLVTGNVRHMARIRGLTVECWSEK